MYQRIWRESALYLWCWVSQLCAWSSMRVFVQADRDNEDDCQEDCFHVCILESRRLNCCIGYLVRCNISTYFSFSCFWRNSLKFIESKRRSQLTERWSKRFRSLMKSFLRPKTYNLNGYGKSNSDLILMVSSAFPRITIGTSVHQIASICPFNAALWFSSAKKYLFIADANWSFT